MTGCPRSAPDPCRDSLTRTITGELIATERVQRLLDPGYATELDTRSPEDLRSMHEECAQAELALSYFRRLAQARMEILEAEVSRRERGGSVGDLVADLPRILSVESGRSTVTTTRGAPRPTRRRSSSTGPMVVSSSWSTRRWRSCRSCRSIELTSTLTALRSFERELSDLRAQLHVVIDKIDRVIADRRVAGAMG